ncbi:glycine cleavage system protein GcvH [Anaerosalibacter bizertensis]|uniref:Glycine cleavage system H protein n=1 Tax=Anaerosalibacter bizertensis TaxID=932217 RepID=A0A844FEC8_9FIRM|nr:glycine cleavage system protein GcvH [Anaerosalibacter bizertensis]HHV26634.1 glycine cleavage system protein GcvH [Tissierellia bacterium]MBU5293763.1 glycine cleavage system protein GcvH [Anaerosalibacter bizertensis]MCG4564886.1 glycine cleavage system protein GcvH [Anaerosalibacter bizertensis]MCG4581579.1 glycine cleavage system protein GcvH [Anaerosalibacter bizertensis]MSS42338.1 glycine cleavage system protein GcvH [Anaerosalibacter bizertensis]
MKVLEGLLYTKDHEWIKVEGDKAYIGVTDYAQDSLGDIVYVELPDIDDEFEMEDSFAVVESVKAAADIYIPVDGRVLEINEELEDDPSLVNEDPYENWMILVELEDKSQLDELMDHEEYEKFLEEEV